ncbi:hypothetical protein G6O69_03595 [Pseudenhygromyxa sp. WMMC2535]|uniref:hypothetical protein n=1 Tax=Pseudenhygromyxa sp. WMMC2535 TaxID=2712867 RepID=UPI0015518C75|nr:hypothetical protein [Pseudenhygromyxa sp. WMMC2535]NVB36899.1 hypothetical protein [Pseudenhygromyxa sp. WMMC2535]
MTVPANGAMKPRDLLVQARTWVPAPRGTRRSRWTRVLAFSTAALVAACSGDGAREEPVDPARGAANEAEDEDQADGVSSESAWAKTLDPGPATKTSAREHALGEAWIIDPERLEEPRKLAIEQAEARGYTVIDLGDGWRPYIFSHKTPGVEDRSENDYAAHYTGLANDWINHDGDPLAAHEHNYLELYGIPPALSVVLDEWRGLEEIEQCLTDAGYDGEVFDPAIGSIVFKKKAGQKRLRSWRWAKSRLEKQMRKAGMAEAVAAGDYAAAASSEDPDLVRSYEYFRDFDREVQVIRNAQIRFRCEKLFDIADGLGKFDAGDYDSATHHALANFEKKHDIMGWGHFTADNIGYLALSPREAVHQRLVRVLSERVVSGAGIVEDGSARDWKPDFRFTDAEGKEHALRDLSSEFTEAAIETLGLGDPDTALARLEQLQAMAVADPEHPEGFGELLVALRLPARPAYYGDDMQFSTVIDRGDVWYDFPWDEEGNKHSQPRKRYPKITLYVDYEGQRIPVIHWRTTIGSWRSELHEGQEYYAYKNSDVGDRVWKTIMAAPVWIPPNGTPVGSLTKLKRVDGRLRRVVNYDETGPGYMSAYGLVAAYHVKLVERSDGSVSVFDNQIRTHGSVDYMSILRRYSHGCHRLYNMNAVRMFSMILQHRPYTREGQTELGAGRRFDYKGKTYSMRLGTRGYKFELDEPIPVTVTEGRVRGSRRSPVTEMMPKPGVEYGEVGPDGEEEAPPVPGEASGAVGE